MHKAAIEEVASAGWAGFSIEAVAARAGVHKTTVYRRWPTRGALLGAAIAATPFRSLAGQVPDTGSLHGDLTALAADMVVAWGEPRTRRVAQALLAARHDPEAARASAAYGDAQLARVAAVVAAARGRGELAEGVDDDVLVELYMGAANLHLLELERAATPAWASALVDAVVRAAGAPIRR